MRCAKNGKASNISLIKWKSSGRDCLLTRKNVTVTVVGGYILAHFTLYWRLIIPGAGDLFCSIKYSKLSPQITQILRDSFI